MRWLKSILTVSTILIALTGCWDSKSIDKRLLPVIMGVDQNEEKKTYTVSLRIPDPQSGKFYVVHAESHTISDALDQMRMNEERSIDLLHLSLVLFSETYAKKGVDDLFQYILRTREIKSKVALAIVKGSVAELISDPGNLRKERGVDMLDLFNTSAGWTPNIAQTYAWEAFRDIHSTTADMAVPIIKKGTETIFQIEDTAFFRNDLMVGTISTDETMLYNLFRGRYISGIVEVTESASLQIVGARVKHRLSVKDGSPRLKSTMYLKAVVLEADEERGLDKEILKRDLEKHLEERFRKLFVKLSQEHSDILMTGIIFRRKLSPEQVDQWQSKLFPKLIVDFRVVADIRNTGNLKLGK